MKVKIFENNFQHTAEKKINEWLATKKDINIKYIKQSSFKCDSLDKMTIITSIFYEE